MCLAQGHNTVTLVRLKPAALRSRVKHSTIEPLCSLFNELRKRAKMRGYAEFKKFNNIGIWNYFDIVFLV